MRIWTGHAVRRGAALLAGVSLAASVLAAPVAAGTGAKLTITPTSWNYGSTLAGNPGVTRTFTIKNTGTVETSGPITVTLGGPNFGDFTKGADTCDGNPGLAPYDTCTIDVQFTPGPLASGKRSATLQAAATPGGAPKAALTGTALNAQLTINPTSWNYGSFPVNEGSGLDKTFTITNVGPLGSGFVNYSISGATADYTFDGGTCSPSGTVTLAAAASCTIIVGFQPLSAGNRNAKLNVSASPGGTVAANLTGTGIARVLGTHVTVWFETPSTDCSGSAANWQGATFTNLVLDFVPDGTCFEGSASPQATISISPNCQGDDEAVSCYFGAAGLTGLAFDHLIGTFCGLGSPGWDVEDGVSGDVYRFGCAYGTHKILKNGWERITFSNADAVYLAGPDTTFPGFGTGFVPTFLQVLQDEAGCTTLANLRINNTVIKTGSDTGTVTCP